MAPISGRVLSTTEKMVYILVTIKPKSYRAPGLVNLIDASFRLSLLLYSACQHIFRLPSPLQSQIQLQLSMATHPVMTAGSRKMKMVYPYMSLSLKEEIGPER